MLIVPRSHPLASKHSIELSETLPFPQIYFSQGSGMRNVVDHLFSQIEGNPQICYETEEDEVIAGLVAQGFGIAVVPYMDMLLKLDLKIIQISSPVWERNFYMVNDDRAYFHGLLLPVQPIAFQYSASGFERPPLLCSMRITEKNPFVLIPGFTLPLFFKIFSAVLSTA